MSNTPHDPADESARLQEIADLDLFDDKIQDLLNDLSAKAAEHLRLPNCNISIVLDEAEFYLSMHGPRTEMAEVSQGAPREWSFCQHVVADRAPFVVSDAPRNERVKDSPFVTVENRRCYAGVPLITSNGFVIGSFCAFGTEAREFSPTEINYLHQMAAETVRRIEARAGREFPDAQRIPRK